jgi:hypothetical protein
LLLAKRITIPLLFVLFFASSAHSQAIAFSLATDLGLQRSFKKEQRYFAGGHTVHALFHFTPTGGAYAWIAYYSPGKFANNLTATAKSPSTIPQEINYLNSAEMRFKHFSVGWKHYFKGNYASEEGYNIFGYAGFGLMLGRVINAHSVFIDTSAYDVPVYSGKANFKRLTLDIGGGWEVPLGGDIFFYTEGRVWVPTTDYPSKHIFVNENAPVVASLNFGVRILF